MASNEKRRISKVYEHALRKNWVKVQENLEPRDIADHLVPNYVITIEECGDICRKDNRKSRIQELMRHIVLGGDWRFHEFMNVLKNYYYDWLYQDINKSIEELENKGNSNETVLREHRSSASNQVRRSAPVQYLRDPSEHEMSGQDRLDVTDSLPIPCHRLTSCPTGSGERTYSNRPASYNPPAASTSGDSEMYDDFIPVSYYEEYLPDTTLIDQSDYDDLFKYIPLSREEIHPPSKSSSSSPSASAHNTPPNEALYANTDLYERDSFSENQPLYTNLDDSLRPDAECNRIMLRDYELISFTGATLDSPPSGLREIENCQGWSPSVSDSNIRKVTPTSKSDDGNFFLWYSIKAEAIVLTIRRLKCGNPLASGGFAHGPQPGLRPGPTGLLKAAQTPAF
ncbi:hypothetical protein FSP39_008540 [Pinctada imbricata]|uniref:CARD domain-containing protein n=1 Tax=Pinctada imbricata TaxID=66713 RepID=A0AA88Y2U6_PINIB|nr:hypothetical protein FSP39_008540 [Pinctada imbricata]